MLTTFKLLHSCLLPVMLDPVFTLLSLNIYFDDVRSCIYYIDSPTHIMYILLFMFLSCIEKPIFADLFHIHLSIAEY
jgi:hypothetical protein